jgi:flagellin-like protein
MLSELPNGDRGATPVIGVAIAVAIILLLATVVTMVVLGADEATDDGGPEMEFAFEYDAEADPTTEDSFGNTGNSFDGLLTIRYEGGDVVRAEQLLVAGAGSEPGRAAFAPAGGYAPEETVESGDTITVWVDSSDSVGVVWNHLETEQSNTVDTWTGPNK